MSARFRRVSLLALLSCIAGAAQAQSIGFSPAAPSSSDAVSAQLSISFDCTIPLPVIADRSGTAITLQSVAPNGIVHCPFIPVPPPSTSHFSVDLGALPAGSYAVTWNVYRMQDMGPDKLVSTVTANLNVSPAVVTAGNAVAALPALSDWSLLALGCVCAAIAALRLRRMRRRD
jgi:hypothetical protein